MSLPLFFTYLAACILVSLAGTVHLLRTQARVVGVLRRDHPEVWERYGQPRPYMRGLSRMPSLFEWKAYRALNNPELDRHCAVLRRSDVVNLLLPFLTLGGLYLLLA